MNEYNHHRIIERVAHQCGISTPIKNIFIEASDFTDFFIGAFGGKLSEWIKLSELIKWKDTAKQKYFFYRFYYTINIKGSNTIRLNRITSNGFIDNNSIKCMENAGEKGFDGKYLLHGWNSLKDEKEFFSSVNDRTRSTRKDMGDTANQSDNVAFLHAMGAEGEIAGDSEDTDTKNTNPQTSRSIFEDHLKKCFAEYLFLEDEGEALFMLGIAFHGIMDSFTPSHMGFQKYTEQDMGLHAQGDVIPVMGKFNEDGELLEMNISEKESISFDPGQFSKEIIRNKFFFKREKHYDNNNFVNPVEYRMLKIFLLIGDIQIQTKVDNWEEANIDELWKNELKGKLVSEINQKLQEKLEVEKLEEEEEKDKYRFGPKSYAYSEAAIKVISNIYQFLSNERVKCKSYSDYKKEKIEEGIIYKALDYWKRVYDGDDNVKVVFLFDTPPKLYSYPMKWIREEHINLSLYTDKELESEYEKWEAQQKIDRLNRLKW